MKLKTLKKLHNDITCENGGFIILSLKIPDQTEPIFISISSIYEIFNKSPLSKGALFEVAFSQQWRGYGGGGGQEVNGPSLRIL